MKSIVMGIWISLFMVTAAYSAPKPPVPVTAQNIIGEWTKKYSLENGNSNSDPRWILKIIFQKDKRFVYDLISTQEIFLVNVKTGEQTAEGSTRKMHVEGIYRLEGDSVFIKFTKDLNHDDEQELAFNFGYDSQRKDAVVRISMQIEDHPLTGDSGKLLSVKGLNTKRLLFFEQENKNNSAAH